MKLQLIIESTENAAFEGDMFASEAARIVRLAAVHIEQGREGGPLMDYNGNRVGSWLWIEE